MASKNLALTKALHTVTVVTRVAHHLASKVPNDGPSDARRFTADALAVLGYGDEARDVRGRVALDALPELLQKCVAATRRALEGGK